jgi:hypothetical protein
MHRLLTRPVKRYDNGGGFKWDALGKLFSSASDPVAPVAGGPTDAGFNQSFQPLSGSIQTGSDSTPSTGTSRFNSVLSGFGKSMDGLVPFASNIVNSMRTPPQPPVPTSDNYVTLRTPSFANDRAMVARESNADAENAARGVDGQTGARIRMYALAKKLDALGSVNQAEHNAQITASNEQARINSGISMRNNEKLDQYHRDQVERQIALQRERSANLANASDKYIGIQNEKRKAQVDLDKTRTMASLFKASGVDKRSRTILRDMGVPDPDGHDYDDLEKKAMGGSVPRRAFYRNLQSRAQTLKSLYKAPS